jgi:hypothetical protein
MRRKLRLNKIYFPGGGQWQWHHNAWFFGEVIADHSQALEP